MKVTMNPVSTEVFRDALQKMRTLQADIELFADGDVRMLNFVGTSVEDADLATVALFSQLERLYLGATRVTDAGMKHLVGLKDLEYLSLHGTEVSEQRRSQLRLLLPNCRVCPRSESAAPGSPAFVEPTVSSVPNATVPNTAITPTAVPASDITIPREILRRVQALEAEVTSLRQLIEQQFAIQQHDS